MAENSAIEWTDHTFNPWVGCTKVSPACDHCYAESWAKRAGSPELWAGERRRTRPANWALPLKWDAAARAAGIRQRVFCASLADVFDNQVPSQWRYDLLALIAATTNLDWLLLTKRIGNAHAMLEEALSDLSFGVTSWAEMPWPNVWIGATVANQFEADRDIPKLLATPARIRFLSIEPMLGPLNFEGMWIDHKDPRMHENVLERIQWVICGGESGPGARPMQAEWARLLRDQCNALEVPFFFKQWGGVRKKETGRVLDGEVWDQFPSTSTGERPWR